MDTALTLKQEIHEVTEKEIIKDEYNFKSCKKYIKFFKKYFRYFKIIEKNIFKICTDSFLEIKSAYCIILFFI